MKRRIFCIFVCCILCFTGCGKLGSTQESPPAFFTVTGKVTLPPEGLQMGDRAPQAAVIWAQGDSENRTFAVTQQFEMAQTIGNFSVDITELPPKEAMFPWGEDGKIAFGLLVIYDDKDNNGKLELTGDSPDRDEILGTPENGKTDLDTPRVPLFCYLESKADPPFPKDYVRGTAELGFMILEYPIIEEIPLSGESDDVALVLRQVGQWYDPGRATRSDGGMDGGFDGGMGGSFEMTVSMSNGARLPADFCYAVETFRQPLYKYVYMTEELDQGFPLPEEVFCFNDGNSYIGDTECEISVSTQSICQQTLCKSIISHKPQSVAVDGGGSDAHTLDTGVADGGILDAGVSDAKTNDGSSADSGDYPLEGWPCSSN